MPKISLLPNECMFTAYSGLYREALCAICTGLASLYNTIIQEIFVVM